MCPKREHVGISHSIMALMPPKSVHVSPISPAQSQFERFVSPVSRNCSGRTDALTLKLMVRARLPASCEGQGQGKGSGGSSKGDDKSLWEGRQRMQRGHGRSQTCLKVGGGVGGLNCLSCSRIREGSFVKESSGISWLFCDTCERAPAVGAAMPKPSGRCWSPGSSAPNES